LGYALDLKQSTGRTITLGPIVDDNKAPVTNVTLSGCDSAVIIKDDGTSVDISGRTWSHIANGIYRLTLTTTDVGTLGQAFISIQHASAFLPIWVQANVLIANDYDSRYSSSLLAVAVTTNNDKAGYALATSPPTASEIADQVWDEARSGHSTSGSFGQGMSSVQGNVTGSVGSVTGGVTVTTNSDKTGYSLSSTPPTAVQIRQEIDSNSTQVAAIKAKTDNLKSSWNDITAQNVWEYSARALSTAPPTAVQIRQEMDSNSTRLAAIVEDTGTTLPSLINALHNITAADVWAYTTRTLTSSGSSGATAQEVWAYATRSLSTAPPTAAQIRTEIDSNSTQVAAIKAKTDNLKSSWNDLSASQVRSQADASILGYRLNELIYAGMSAPAATSVFGSLIEYHTDHYRYRDTALELAPHATGEGGLTAADVWGYSSRSLTTSPLSAADIWSYSGRALSVSPPTAAQIRTEMDTNSAKLSLVGTLQGDWANGGRLDTLLDTLLSRLSEARGGYLDKLNVGGALANTSNADLFKADISGISGLPVSVRTEMDNNSSRLRAIEVDTDELQGTLHTGGRLDLIIGATRDNTDTIKGDLINGGRLDLILDAIKADTGTTIPALIAALNNPSAAQIWNYAIENGYTAQQMLRLCTSMLAGAQTVQGNLINARSLDNTKTRIQFGRDGNGGRTVISRDVSP
jgi:hypothetical protein